MEIILSTRNPSKAEQIKSIFEGTQFSIITLTEAGIEGEAIEDGKTLEENALKKAIFAQRQSPGFWTMADDTGLFINALGGKPGVRAARWAGESATTEQIMAHTIKSLKDCHDRSATFETIVALLTPDGKKYFFSGKVSGKLLESPRVKPQPRMPYSPIFLPDGESLVWAEMSVDYENNISHRGKAFRQVRDFLLSLT